MSNQNKAFADTDQPDPSRALPNLTDQSLYSQTCLKQPLKKRQNEGLANRW